MQITAQPRQESESFLELGRRIGRAHPRSVGRAQLLQPAEELVIAEAAGSLLDVGLEVIERPGEPRMTFASKLAQIANQRLAVGVNETRQSAGQLGIERAVARKVALIEQTDIQLDI